MRRPGWESLLRSPWLLAGGLALVVVLLYWRAGGFEFLYCDDDVYVFRNQVVLQGLTLQGFGWAFLDAHAANWHPLTWLSHMLDVQLFGLDAGWHHRVNVGFHAANAALLFALLLRMTGRPWRAAAVAAFFAWHPLRVESVAWVAERKDVLSLFLGLLTLLAYVRYARRPDWRPYLAVVVLFALGLMAKAMLVTLPLAMLLIDVWPLQRGFFSERAAGAAHPGNGPAFAAASAGRLVLEKIPLLVLSAAASFGAVLSQGEGGALGDLATLPLGARVANAFTATASYLGKTFWPLELGPFYPHPALLSPQTYSPWNAAAIAAAALLLLITAVALVQRRSRPYLAVGWLWFLGTLVPVIGLVQVADQGMADRYTYLPSIGLTLACVWCVADWAGAGRSWRRWSCAALTTGLLVACIGTSWRQVGYWHDGVSVFERSVAVSPESYFGHNHLGRAYENQGEIDRAGVAYQRAVELRPAYAGAHSNLGSVLSKTGRYAEAIAHLEQALALRPRRASFHSNLGLVYAEQGNWQYAFDAYGRALSLSPNYPTAHLNLGLALSATGKPKEAAAHLQRALELDPGNANTANALGVALSRLDQLDAAENAYAAALRVAPGHTGALCNLGELSERQGELARAESFYGQAVRGRGDCAPGRRFFGRRLLAQGNPADAALQFEKLVALQPGSADAHSDLGVAYVKRGRIKAAQEQWIQALEIDPDHASARKNLEVSLHEPRRAEQPTPTGPE